jgi:hypothetical protein
MKVGEVIINSIWMTGDEPEGMKERYKKDILDSFDVLCRKEGFVHGPITVSEKRPGEGIVPVPDHIQGSKVRLLILEAELVEKLVVEIEPPSFVGNLDRKDLVKLRKITRDRAAKTLKKIISNDECDFIIETLGPDAAVATLRTIH